MQRHHAPARSCSDFALHERVLGSQEGELLSVFFLSSPYIAKVKERVELGLFESEIYFYVTFPFHFFTVASTCELEA
jgi:hypothetical protein